MYHERVAVSVFLEPWADDRPKVQGLWPYASVDGGEVGEVELRVELNCYPGEPTPEIDGVWFVVDGQHLSAPAWVDELILVDYRDRGW